MAVQPTRSQGERIVTYVLVAVAVGALVLVVLYNPGLIRFWPFTAAEFVQFITPLVLVALFIERALEVFLTPWRAEKAERLKQEAAHAPRATANRLRTELVRHKAVTRRFAFGGGLVAGILVSAVGVRALGLFVDPAVFRSLSDTRPFQAMMFNLVDVLLTGAVLGGGAEGIHKIVSVFTNFLESTADRAKKETPVAP